MSQFDPRFFDDKEYIDDDEEFRLPYDPMFTDEEEALENDHRLNDD
jgi:hypothetical protein